MRLRTVRLAALLLIPVLLAAGCSSDGDGKDEAKDADRTTTSTTADNGGTTPDGVPVEDTVPNPTPPPAPDRTKYCQVWSRLMQTTGQDFDSSDPNSVKSHYNAVVGVARELESVAPLDIKGAVQVAIRESEKVAASGDTSANDTDESRVNGRRLQDYAGEHCK